MGVIAPGVSAVDLGRADTESRRLTYCCRSGEGLALSGVCLPMLGVATCVRIERPSGRLRPTRGLALGELLESCAVERLESAPCGEGSISILMRSRRGQVFYDRPLGKS